MCDKHFGDPWTSEIKHRLNNCVDLVAEETRCHEQCRNKFFLNLSSTQDSPKEIPSNNIKLENFENLCLWLERAGELYSLKELHDKMEKEANETDTYSCRWMKVKLVEKYGERIYFSEINGKSDIVCFKNTADILINDAWYNERNENSENEDKKVLDLAAKITLGQIRSTEFDTSHYPTNDLIKDTEK